MNMISMLLASAELLYLFSGAIVISTLIPQEFHDIAINIITLSGIIGYLIGCNKISARNKRKRKNG